jgi:hypothetical protein
VQHWMVLHLVCPPARGPPPGAGWCGARYLGGRGGLHWPPSLHGEATCRAAHASPPPPAQGHSGCPRHLVLAAHAAALHHPQPVLVWVISAPPMRRNGAGAQLAPCVCLCVPVNLPATSASHMSFDSMQPACRLTLGLDSVAPSNQPPENSCLLVLCCPCCPLPPPHTHTGG